MAPVSGMGAIGRTAASRSLSLITLSVVIVAFCIPGGVRGTLPYLTPSYVFDQDSGLVVFTFGSIPSGVDLICSLKNGPRGINCTRGYRLNTEVMKHGRHVMDIRAFRQSDSVLLGVATQFFVISKEYTLNVQTEVEVLGSDAKLCFTTSRPATFRCRLGQGQWEACYSCQWYRELCPGAYSLQVEATSMVNDESSVLKSDHFEIAFSELQAALSTSVSGERAVQMCFTASRESRFDCRLNSGTWQACTSCHLVSGLCPGFYHSEVRATSVHCPDITTTVGKHLKVGPSLEITHAGLDVGCRSGRYELQSNFAALWRCRLDGRPWIECSHGMDQSELRGGSHTLLVEAYSVCNQSERVERSLSVVVPGRVTVDHIRVSSKEERDHLFAEFSTCSLTSTFCRIDSERYHPCSSPFTIPYELAPGPHLFHIKAELDGVVYATEQRPFFKELVLRITGKTEVDGHRVKGCFFSNYPATYQCRLDQDDWELCAGGCMVRADLCPGQHVLSVRGTAVDNTTVVETAKLPFSVEDTSLAVNISTSIDESTVTVCFQTPRMARFECQLDSQEWTLCVSCVRFQGLCAGQHMVRVRAVSTACAASVGGSAQTVVTVQSTLAVLEASMSVRCVDGTYHLRANQPSSLNCRIGGGEWKQCFNRQEVFGLPVGSFHGEVEASLLCNPAIKATRSFRVGVPNNATVENLAVSQVADRTVVVSFSACEALVYECQLDRSSSEPCTSPHVYSGGLAPGDHSVQVRALLRGASGQDRELDATKLTFHVDLKVGSRVTVQGSKAVFCFSSTHEGRSRCRLDDSVWTQCTSCTTYSELCPGSHTVTVNATSVESPLHFDASSRKFDITVKDLDVKSSSRVDGEEASVCFRSDRRANYQCQLNGGPWRDCSSCANYTGLCAGDHVVQIRGSSSFCPSVTGSSLQRFRTRTDLKFTKAAMDVECDEGTFSLQTSHPAVLRCRVGSTPWIECSDGSVVSRIQRGTHEVMVEARLLCNRAVRITTSFTIGAPAKVVVSGVDTTYNAQGHLVASFSACPIATYTCSVDGGRAVMCSSPHVFEERFQPGSHTLRVRIFSNILTTQAAAEVTFNTALTANSSVQVNGSNAKVCFTASHLADFECRLDQQQWQQCSGCHSYAQLCPGQHRAQVRATAHSDASIATLTSNNFVITDNSISVAVESSVGDDSESVRVCSRSSREANLFCRIDNNPWRECSSCELFADLCAGAHSVEVRAVSSVCTGVEGRAETRFDIQSDFKVTLAEIEVGCDTGVLELATSHPATMRCRVDNKLWLPCASGDSVSDLRSGSHSVEVEASLLCNPEVKAFQTLEFLSPDMITIPSVQETPAQRGMKMFTFEECQTAEYECYFGSFVQKCSSPFSVAESTLSPGLHSLAVFAMSEVSILAHHTTTFSIDLHVTLSTVVEGSDVTVCPNASHTARLECRLDTGPWEECSGCRLYSVVCPGDHTASVRAAAGSVRARADQAFVVRNYDLDLNLVTSLSEDLFTACVHSSVKGQFECRLRGLSSRGQWHSCSNCTSYADLCTDEYSFEVRATSRQCSDVQGRHIYPFSIQPRFEFLQAELRVECSTGRFALVTSLPATFICRLNGEDWQPCSNGHVIEGLSAGRHDVEIEASLVCNPLVKSTTTFTADVPGIILVGEVTVSRDENGLVAAFQECSVAEYYCSIDSGEETICSSPYSIPSDTPSGGHILIVAAKAFGRVLSSTESHFTIEEREFQLMTVSVEVRMCGALLYVQTNITGVVCLCYLDDDEQGKLCTSGQVYQGLAQGDHSVRIEGAVEGKVEYQTTVHWKTTSKCLEGRIYASVRPHGNSATLKIYISPPNSSFVCRLDQGVWNPCTHETVFNNLDEGDHVIELEAKSFLHKTTRKKFGPFNILHPLFSASGEAYVSSSTAILHLRSNRPASFVCRIDRDSWQPCSDGHSYQNLPPGSHVFQVRATESRTGRRVDLVLGPVRVDKNVSRGQCRLYSYVVSSQGQARVHIRAAPVSLTTCRIDGGQWRPCYDGATFSNVDAGRHAIEVKLMSALCSQLPPLKLAFIMEDDETAM